VICRRCIVSGRVQGVFFRASTQARALALGVHGHARNLPDGQVEVLACGKEPDVIALCAWLQTGPPQARVNAVQCVDVETTVPSGFSTG
jgi:acylphosphatase